jgi:hypothetical protein
MDGKFIPSSDAASAAVAENEAGEIVGVLFLQLALHMEPLILTSPQVSFKSLYNTIHDAVASDKGLRIYCFSDKEIIDRMAEHVGMTALPAKIFMKEF